MGKGIYLSPPIWRTAKFHLQQEAYLLLFTFTITSQGNWRLRLASRWTVPPETSANSTVMFHQTISREYITSRAFRRRRRTSVHGIQGVMFAPQILLTKSGSTDSDTWIYFSLLVLGNANCAAYFPAFVLWKLKPFICIALLCLTSKESGDVLWLETHSYWEVQTSKPDPMKKAFAAEQQNVLQHKWKWNCSIAEFCCINSLP